MKLRFLSAATLAAVAALYGSAAAAECSNATLDGQYAFTVRGESMTPNGLSITNGVAMTRFDGAGHLTQVDFVLDNGLPSPGPVNAAGFHNHETGSYSVNSDCTGRAEIDGPAPPGLARGVVIQLMFVLSNHGRAIHTVVVGITPPGAPGPVPTSVHSDGYKVGGEGDGEGD
ncbi:MAG TPA: hypothetical protein VJV22_05750 [Acidobacteriaceae bacterium]|nr:hypothetical protein [Acidobacteriaceae bacterium]